MTEDELDAALAQQRLSSTRRLGEILVARGALSEGQVSRALAEQHELPFVELEEHDIDPAARALLPVELARRHSALPISYLPDGSVLVVVADPTCAIHDDELRAELGVSVQYAVAVPAEIETAIASTSEVERVEAPQIEIADAVSSPVDDEADERPAADAERPTFTLVPALTEQDEDRDEARAATAVHETLEHALSLGASAIHFTPRSAGMVVHGRIDGDLRELAILPHSDRVRNDLGRLVGVDLTRSVRSRHGRPAAFGATLLQAAVLPTVRGPRVTFRAVDEASTRLSLFDLVTDASQREAVQDALAERQGMLVFCGTPGSEPRTTLYAALLELDPSERNVLTIDNPVEDQIEGIDQIELDVATGVTAASGLRAILASDPDVVAVGALVDRETARAAVRGALETLVLTTLVAPTASAGVRRLTELGGETALVGVALTGVVAQRIVRKTCLACRETYYAAADELAELGLPLAESDRRLLGRGRGCDECGGSGHQGQARLVEVLSLTDDVRALIAGGASSVDIEGAAVAAGMRTLREQGIGLCLEGVITTAELRATADRPRRSWQS